MKTLTYAAPAEAGIPAGALVKLLKEMNSRDTGAHSLMIARRGKVVLSCRWKPYSLEDVHMLYSLSKSFTSTAVGFAVKEGKLRLSDKVVSFFPEKLPQRVFPRLRTMTVENLLTMAAGHDPDPTRAVFGSEDWIGAFFAQPLPTQPGTHFVYNTAATFMLSAITQKVTGEKIIDYLRPRLFEPLGFNMEGIYWEESPEGICQGGSGLHIHNEDILRFGICLLQKGRFGGQQVIPEEWVELATAKHIPNGDPATGSDWNQGYGYQFWRCVPREVYRGDGAYGQYCIVCPEQEMVIAMNSGTDDLQTPMTLFWETLLPALDTASDTEDADRAELEAMLEQLQRPTQPCAQHCPCPNRHPERGGFYRAEDNELGVAGLELAFANCDGTLTFHYGGKTYSFTCGPWRWRRGSLPGLYGRELTEVGVSAAWQDDGSFAVRAAVIGYPGELGFRLAFEGDTCLMHCSTKRFRDNKEITVRLRKEGT